MKILNQLSSQKGDKGFNHVLDNLSDYKTEINSLAQPYLSANKKIVAIEAKKIIRRTEK